MNIMLKFAILFIFFIAEIHGKSVSNKTALKTEDGCVCKTTSCECCVILLVPEIRLNDSGCVGVAYLPDEYGVSVWFKIDDYNLINETISARNPPPLCMAPPEFDLYLHICLRFYDLNIIGSAFHACVQLEFKMFYVFNLDEIKLGCFVLGTPSSKVAQHLTKLLAISSMQNATTPNSTLNSYPDWPAVKKALDSKMYSLYRNVANKTVQYEKVAESALVDFGNTAGKKIVEYGNVVGENFKQLGNQIVGYEKIVENKASILGKQISSNAIELENENMTLTTSCAPPDLCPESHLSAGSVLVIIFVISVSLYLLLGIIHSSLTRNAHGCELIPHHQFWTDFFLSVRDGCVYVTSGCKTDKMYEGI